MKPGDGRPGSPRQQHKDVPESGSFPVTLSFWQGSADFAVSRDFDFENQFTITTIFLL
jgi:hypothetical protein